MLSGCLCHGCASHECGGSPPDCEPLSRLTQPWHTPDVTSERLEELSKRQTWTSAATTASRPVQPLPPGVVADLGQLPLQIRDQLARLLRQRHHLLQGVLQRQQGRVVALAAER